MENILSVFQHHFARMWAERHDGSAHARSSLRDNIRGQRHCRAHIAQGW